MKNINSIRPNANLIDILILVIRVSVGLSMLTHGIPKLETLVLNNQIQFVSFLGMGSIFSMVLVVFAEFLCSVFLMFGFLTRLACIPLIVTMLVACFMVHGADAYAEKELSVLYFFLYLVIIVLGSGRFSIDRLLVKRHEAY